MKITKVKIRTKAMINNRLSVRLDYYPPITHPETGKPKRFEYTGLYYFDKPKTALERQHNKETKALAETLRATRQLEVQAGQLGFLTSKGAEPDFIAYFKKLAEKREGTNLGNWNGALLFLKEYFGDTFPMGELNAQECEDFREYLLTAKKQRGREKKPIATNTAVSYYGKFKAALKEAYKEGHLATDLNQHAKSIKQEETAREFLTLEELQKLATTPCPDPLLRRAALFSALTGMRFSDVENLAWPDVQHSKADGYSVRFRQQKTGGAETLPISEQAFNLLGERGTGKVFAGLVYSGDMLDTLREWVKAAGITKHITFHCFRHTFATLQLSAGTDIYTVSKMLGHRELKTTQVYAKVVDKLKQTAASKIQLDIKIIKQ